MFIALAALLALCIVCLAYVTARSRVMPGPALTGTTVAVHTRDGQQFRGILHAQHADRWTLRDAVFVAPVGDQAVGGLQHIPIANLSWAQEIRTPVQERGK